MRPYISKARHSPQFLLFFTLAVILILIPVCAPWTAPNDPIENDYDNLMILLETRLDALVYRMGFARTIFAARQYVAHGHFSVNGVRSFSPARLVKAGDVIAVRERSKEHVQIKEAIANAPAAPEYLSVDAGKMEGTLVKLPLRDQIPVQLEEQLVVEYYSR